jgi:hypothetical protein
MHPNLREPVLHATPILALRPTQMTLGLQEVDRKRENWRLHDPQSLADFLGTHMVPVILGPGGERYLTDHHHLARALYDEGVARVFVTVIADLRRLDTAPFWNAMDFHGWTHPYDEHGHRRPYADLPRNVKGMKDDPYRSLAGELRNIGGFAKDSTPFSEFLWADFLRGRIKIKAIKADFAAALSEAMRLAKSGDADYLPGWCGPHGDGGVSAAGGSAPGKKKRKKRGPSAAEAASGA